MDDMEPSTPKTHTEERSSGSSATSTPGGHHLFSALEDPSITMKTPPTIQSSDLLNSDESTVFSSTMGDDSSVVQYEKDAEDTTILDGTQNESPIANRTRSHSVSMIPNSMTEFQINALISTLKKEIGEEEDKEKEREKAEKAEKEEE